MGSSCMGCFGGSCNWYFLHPRPPPLSTKPSSRWTLYRSKSHGALTKPINQLRYRDPSNIYKWEAALLSQCYYHIDVWLQALAKLITIAFISVNRFPHRLKNGNLPGFSRSINRQRKLKKPFQMKGWIQEPEKWFHVIKKTQQYSFSLLTASISLFVVLLIQPNFIIP